MNFPETVSFHNVAELEPSAGGPAGVVLRRFPRSVREDPGLSPIGRDFTSHTSNGCEIRLVATAPVVRVDLTSSCEGARVFVLRGEYPYRGGFFPLPRGALTTLVLEAPDLSERETTAFALDRFPPTVWRIYALDTQVTFGGVAPGDAGCRPPTAAEQPSRRWLAYGSSITQSGEDYYGYLNVAAQLLGVDPLNLGMGGSCFMEESVGDFLAAREDWTFATLELGINVLSHLSVEEFGSRARRLIHRLHHVHPQKPIFVITTFRSGLDHATVEDPVWVGPNRRQRAVLADLVRELGSPQVRLLDGLAIFPDLVGLQADLLHPAPLGSVRAGTRLAEMLSAALGTPLRP